MRIAVLGTGVVGRAIATGLGRAGHQVVIGTRDPAAALGRDALASWHAEHPGVVITDLAAANASADLVVNATNGAVALDALTAAGAANLAGTVLVDVANPLDFSTNATPSLLVANTDSLAERIQRAFPATRVVKALNTMGAELMADPALVAGHSCFVAGDDPAARAQVVALLTDMGQTDVIDLGDLTAARGCEMYVVLWMRVWRALGERTFGLKVVRE